MASEVVSMKPTATAVAARKSTAQTVALVASILPPKLAEGATTATWMQTMVDTIGEHPQEVLDEAHRVVLSTCSFAPSPKEFVDAVLVAYGILKAPMSEDGKRHLAYRKRLGYRYVQSETGRQVFANDVRLATIAHVQIAGVHANMVLTQCADATVADVERAIVEAGKAKWDKPRLNEVIDRISRECEIVVAHRIAGPPEGLIGGPVAVLPSGSHTFHFRSDFLCLDQAFVDGLGLRPEAIIRAFFAVTQETTRRPDDYGPEWQARAERLIASKARAAA